MKQELDISLYNLLFNEKYKMKKFNKCTIEELLEFCNKNQCEDCPLWEHSICSNDFQIWELKQDQDNLEIEIKNK